MFRIRAATASDAGALARLLVEVNDFHVDAMPGFFRPIAIDDQALALVRAHVAAPDTVVFVAEWENGSPIGYVLVAIRNSPATPVLAPRRFAEIDTLVVGAPFRGRGIGQALVEQEHRWAVERGVDQIQLSVLELNRPAMAFYGRLGFATLRRTMWRALPLDHRWSIPQT